MSRMPSSRRRVAAPLAMLILLSAALAVPAFGAEPSGPPGPPGQGNKPDHAGPKDKAKDSKEPITLRGTVSKATDESGGTIYQLTSGGTTYTLDAGPAWFLGSKHPLEPVVGETVTIVGEIADGSTEVDVETIDGSAVREGGKPPWAGGWQRVGEKHPGWSAEKSALMAEKLEARRLKFGGCFPPGLCRKAAAADEATD